ncbi:MAG: asparagine synthetase B family protein [Neisseriaceae bacterium]|nr:MAG: asparagine synthetase B family protein [Neisseriaceae bacterium]
MRELVNVSHWQSFSVGGKTYYLSNDELVIQLKQNLQAEFWQNTYVEFACVIVDNVTGVIRLVRDHFGCEPFFYFMNQQYLYFASSLAELVSTLRQRQIPISVNENELKYMLLTGKALSYPTEVHEDTLYNGIKRVQPNHLVSILEDKITQTQYWNLANHHETIYYKDENEYLEHFTELFHEGIKLQLGDETALAAECSGGLDSSSIILAAHCLNKPLTLYTHLDQDYDSNSPRLRESYFVAQLVEKYGLKHSNIDASSFDLSEVLNMTTEVLAGQIQSLFPIGANIIHAQAAGDKTKILLSGFGGDECVSGHAYLWLCLSQWFKCGEYKKAWQEYRRHYAINNLSKPLIFNQVKSLLRAKFPILGERYALRNHKCNQQKFAKLGFSLPDYVPKATSIAEFEIRQLIGLDNNHISYRIEDSALIARHYGFKYKYPLLYPKLIEFCNRLPLSMKRQNGLARIMIRKYLAQAGMPEFMNKPIAKFDGNIMGSTFSKMRQTYQNDFKNQLNSQLPYWEVKEQILKANPNILENIDLYQNLALLSLNQFLVK